MIEQPHSNTIRQQAIKWLVRKQSGAFAGAERQRFEQWLAADPQHRRIYEQVERAWDGLPRPQDELSVARKK